MEKENVEQTKVKENEKIELDFNLVVQNLTQQIAELNYKLAVERATTQQLQQILQTK